MTSHECLKRRPTSPRAAHTMTPIASPIGHRKSRRQSEAPGDQRGQPTPHRRAHEVTHRLRNNGPIRSFSYRNQQALYPWFPNLGRLSFDSCRPKAWVRSRHHPRNPKANHKQRSTETRTRHDSWRDLSQEVNGADVQGKPAAAKTAARRNTRDPPFGLTVCLLGALVNCSSLTFQSPGRL